MLELLCLLSEEFVSGGDGGWCGIKKAQTWGQDQTEIKKAEPLRLRLEYLLSKFFTLRQGILLFLPSVEGQSGQATSEKGESCRFGDGSCVVGDIIN